MKKMIIISVLVLIGFSFLYLYREYNREVKNISTLHPDFNTTDESLIAEFNSNESSAIKKYSGKLIEISGIISSSEKNNEPVISLGRDAQIKVRCVFEKLPVLPNSGSEIIIRGYCTGFNKDELIGSDILLNRCVVVNSAP